MLRPIWKHIQHGSLQTIKYFNSLTLSWLYQLQLQNFVLICNENAVLPDFIWLIYVEHTHRHRWILEYIKHYVKRKGNKISYRIILNTAFCVEMYFWLMCNILYWCLTNIRGQKYIFLVYKSEMSEVSAFSWSSILWESITIMSLQSPFSCKHRSQPNTLPSCLFSNVTGNGIPPIARIMIILLFLVKFSSCVIACLFSYSSDTLCFIYGSIVAII